MTYLDNAATSYPKPEAVYRVMDEFARTSGGNPGRAGHRSRIVSLISVHARGIAGFTKSSHHQRVA